MRYGKITVCLFTAVFLAVAVFVWSQEPEQEAEIPIFVTVSSQEGTQNIRCWENDGGMYYVFLPSYAELAQTRIRTTTFEDVFLDGQLLTDGMSCECFQWNMRYDLSCTAKDGSCHFSLMFLQSANVPAMYIDVSSGSMDYIHREKGNEEAGLIRLYTAEGALDHYGNLDSIKGRGNSSWNPDKKPYSLKLSTEADLLGMGRAREWILLANAFDPSQMRNKLVYDFASAAGLAYSPDSAWVDLYLNGEYAGLYLLSERNEIHPQRVAIEADSGFLVSTELASRAEEKENPFICTGNGTMLRIHQSAMKADDLEDLWLSAENAILAEDGIDPISGKQWTELIDLDSWVRKYLIEEIFGNLDAGAISQYFYGDQRTSIIFAGPVWDYDISMSNSVAWQIQQPNAFFANRAILWTGMDQPWFHALYQKEEFYNRMVELYETEFRPLLADFLKERIDGYSAYIAKAAKANLLRWPMQEADDAETIKTFLTERMAFLDSVWLENTKYCYVLVNVGEENNTANFAVLPGEKLPELPEFESSSDVIYYGWYCVDTDAPFDITKPIYEDTSIYLKYSDTEESSGEESDSAGAVQDFIFLFRMVLLVCFALLFAAVLIVNVLRERTSAGRENRICFPSMKDRVRTKRKDKQEDECSKISS